MLVSSFTLHSITPSLRPPLATKTAHLPIFCHHHHANTQSVIVVAAERYSQRITTGNIHIFNDFQIAHLSGEVPLCHALPDVRPRILVSGHD